MAPFARMSVSSTNVISGLILRQVRAVLPLAAVPDAPVRLGRARAQTARTRLTPHPYVSELYASESY